MQGRDGVYIEHRKVWFREIDGPEELLLGESGLEYRWFHHPTGKSGEKLVAVQGGLTNKLKLLNAWNSQPETGYQYHEI